MGRSVKFHLAARTVKLQVPLPWPGWSSFSLCSCSFSFVGGSREKFPDLPSSWRSHIKSAIADAACDAYWRCVFRILPALDCCVYDYSFFNLYAHEPHAFFPVPVIVLVKNYALLFARRQNQTAPLKRGSLIYFIFSGAHTHLHQLGARDPASPLILFHQQVPKWAYFLYLPLRTSLALYRTRYSLCTEKRF